MISGRYLRPCAQETSPLPRNRERLRIGVGDASVSALLIRPANSKALYLFAHGAGAGMTHKSMESNAEGLAARGIATLRYQFPYMEKGSKRPDPPRIAHAAVRAAAAEAARLAPDLPLFAGGRSFGGRMTSQAQAVEALPGVRGLAFLGFPLHPAGKPGIERAEHLARVEVPMLFVSGERDALAELDLLRPVVAGRGERATLHLVARADHSLKVPAKSGRTAAEAEAEALDAMAEWMLGLS
jgi:predicted alpha/beta-hydrolase family hydrolase